MVYTDHDAKIDKLYAIKDRMVKGLQAMDGVTVHGLTGRDSAPQIVAAGFEGGERSALHALEDKGIYVSSGSACSSNHPGVRNLKGDRREGFPARFHTPLSLRRIQYGGRGGLLPGRVKRACSDVAEIPQSVNIETNGGNSVKYRSFLIKYAEIGVKGKEPLPL